MLTDGQKIENMRAFINSELQSLNNQWINCMSPTAAATFDVRIKEMNHVRETFVAIFGARQ